MVLDILLAGGIGTAYGYMKTGRQDKGELFKIGLIWGLIIGAVLGLIGYLVGSTFLLTAGGVVALVLGVVLLVAAFVGGVFLGDYLEHR